MLAIICSEEARCMLAIICSEEARRMLAIICSEEARRMLAIRKGKEMRREEREENEINFLHYLILPRVGVRVPVGRRIFNSPYRPYRICGPPNLLSNVYLGSFPRG
jgi:hypothetical protein